MHNLFVHDQYINAFDEANKRISELMSTSKKFAAFLQGASPLVIVLDGAG